MDTIKRPSGQITVAAASASVLLLLMACNGTSTETQNRHTGSETTAVSHEAGKGMSQSGQATPGGYSKPGAPISLQAKPAKVDAAGVAVEVSFVVSASNDLATVSLQLGGENIVINSSNLVSVGDMQRGEERVIAVRLTPSVTGRQYLAVNAKAKQNGQLTYRAFAVPIDVAGDQPAMKNNGRIGTTPSGRRIISMPADEG